MSGVQPATYAAGVRRRFEDLPPVVTDWVVEHLGSALAGVRNQVGGFSPGVAAVVTGDTEERVFVKAVGAEVNPDSLALYRAEREVAARLPRLPGIVLPTAGVELEADGETFVVLVFPALEGAPPRHPWRTDQLDRVLDALSALSSRLTPSPWPARDTDQRLPDFFRWWELVVSDPDDAWSHHPWVRRHAGWLIAAEDHLRRELVGDTLTHTDLRADNLMLGGEQVWFVDWAHAQNAAPWVDAAILLGDVIASHADVGSGGDVDVAARITSSPVFRGVGAEPVWRLLVSLAAALHGMSARPSPPGLPTIRRWQASTAQTLLEWCQHHADRR